RRGGRGAAAEPGGLARGGVGGPLPAAGGGGGGLLDRGDPLVGGGFSDGGADRLAARDRAAPPCQSLAAADRHYRRHDPARWAVRHLLAGVHGGARCEDRRGGRASGAGGSGWLCGDHRGALASTPRSLGRLWGLAPALAVAAVSVASGGAPAW